MRHYKHEIAKIWLNTYGNNAIARDIAGRVISFDEFGALTEFGWNIDHIKPISKGGTDVIENILPMHWKTNQEKKDDFPEFQSNNKTFLIKSKKVRRSNDKYKDGWEINIIKKKDMHG